MRTRGKTSTRTRGAGFALALATMTGGCYAGLHGFDADDAERVPDGAADGGADDGADGGDDDGADDGGDAANACARAGAAPPRLLTREQYAATVQDLLGVDLPVTEGFLPDAQVGGYWNNEDQPMTLAAAEQYMRAAEDIADAVDLAVLAPCDEAGGDDPHACLDDFLADVAPRAYRRPLPTEAKARLVALYDDARADPELLLGHAAAVRVVLRAILQSPFFLSHIELGDASRPDADGNLPLTGHEVASRLSYTLWGTMPDDLLLDAAESGVLDDEAGVRTQAERLLADPRSRPSVRAFFMRWLRLDEVDAAAKEPSQYPQWTPELRASMQAQTEAFLDALLWGEDDGTLQTLFLAEHAYVDDNLALLYGLEPTFGDALVRVDLDSADRRGVLGLPAWLTAMAGADQSSPTLRGVFVRERLLCEPVPAPPGDVIPDLPPSLPGETPVDRVNRHLEDPSCAACHTLFDPIGLGFEHFDAIGGFREAYGEGQPVSAQGNVAGSQDDAVNGEFTGLPELVAKLAGSEEVRACVGKQALVYAIGHAAETAACGKRDAVDYAIAEALEDNGGDLRTLMLHVVTSDALRMRAP